MPEKRIIPPTPRPTPNTGMEGIRESSNLPSFHNPPPPPPKKES
jgi:hypothetical protein